MSENKKTRNSKITYEINEGQINDLTIDANPADIAFLIGHLLRVLDQNTEKDETEWATAILRANELQKAAEAKE